LPKVTFIASEGIDKKLSEMLKYQAKNAISPPTMFEF